MPELAEEAENKLKNKQVCAILNEFKLLSEGLGGLGKLTMLEYSVSPAGQADGTLVVPIMISFQLDPKRDQKRFERSRYVDSVDTKNIICSKEFYVKFRLSEGGWRLTRVSTRLKRWLCFFEYPPTPPADD